MTQNHSPSFNPTNPSSDKNTLGICILPEPPLNAPRTVRYGAYLHEILGLAGLCYASFTPDELPAALEIGSSLKILVTIGEWPFPAELQTQMQNWIQDGGAWISIAGICGMPDLLGA